MGSPEGVGYNDQRPRHKVQINDFWIGKYQVTQAEYEALIGTNPSEFKDDARRPVEKVRWHDAKEFCEKFGSKYGVIARLPTEAEWEYAARAGTMTEYYWGDEFDSNYCWDSDNSDSITHPVGEKRPNAWGLYDMSGNVWEWCEDWFEEGYYAISPSKDPKGPPDGASRVLRGGSRYGVNDVRSAYRAWGSPESRGDDLGFRVVLSAPSP